MATQMYDEAREVLRFNRRYAKDFPSQWALWSKLRDAVEIGKFTDFTDMLEARDHYEVSLEGWLMCARQRARDAQLERENRANVPHDAAAYELPRTAKSAGSLFEGALDAIS